MSFAPPLFTALIERLAKAHNANVERRMSVVVTGLADTVRAAKAAISAAGASATRLKSSAEAVVATIGTVDGMTKQLDAANADLQAAVAGMTNGDPNPGPLPGTVEPAPVSPPVSPPVAPTSATDPASHVVADIPTSIAAVQNAHVAAVAPAYVAPAVVTASTIAAANAAAAAAAAANTTIPVKP